MKNKTITLIFWLFVPACFSQELRMDIFEQSVCDCIEQKFDSIGIDINSELLKFEEYLIEKGQLKDSSGKSYYKIFQETAKNGSIPICADYPIDGLTIKNFALYSRCFHGLKNNEQLLDSDSKLNALYEAFTNLANRGNFYASSIAKEITKILKPKEFEKDIYRFYALHTFYYSANTNIPSDKKHLRYLAAIYINSNHEVFLNENLIPVNRIAEEINQLKKQKSLTELDTVNIRLFVEPEVKMSILSDVKNELKKVKPQKLYYIIEK